ncbi:hypothetical protein [Thomasclavelia cocleata]|jgi:restriction endonuclease S subunit|uniref:hypothetical protein n=1 Tax=Thomasclavelia cocleata TaxID=69824 RepID=UPI002576EF86|nr:hypothetical protein [Thomasclavelia cocleata]
MNGLECKEILLSNTLTATDYFRLEAEYYNSTTISYQSTLKGKDIVFNIQYGTSKYCDEQKDGYPVLRLNELHNSFIDIPQKYCHILSPDEFEELRLKKGDVLVIRTNGNPNLVGRAAVVLDDSNFAFASYLYRITTNEKINPETLVAYLNCKYGRYEIDKNSIKSNQTNFSPAKFRDINIPIFNTFLQNIIKNVFDKAYQCRVNADSEFVSAEQMLISAVGFASCGNNSNNVSIKSFSESFSLSGRLDSEYYLPKYDEYKNMINSQETINSLCTIYNENYIPNNKTKYKYIELSNIGTIGDINDVEEWLGEKLPTRARRKIKKGQVIVSSIEGSLQSCALVTEEYHNAICSTGFYVIDSPYINSETLLVLLKSIPIQALLKQQCSGTILTAVNVEDFKKINLPKIDIELQGIIKEKINNVYKLKNEAKQLLDYAKQAVEMAIEQNEEVALDWLKDKTCSYEVEI